MTEGTGRLAAVSAAVLGSDLHRRHGRVSDLIGLIVEATSIEAEVGEVCLVETGRNGTPVPAEVVGFRDQRTLFMPLGDTHGIGPGKAVTATGEPFRVPVGDDLLGRVVDGLGRPLDRGPAPYGRVRSTQAGPPDPLERTPIEERVYRWACAPSTRSARPRPAPRHLRRLGGAQVLAPGHDRPLDIRPT